jgi:hypothetical protein
MSQTRTITLTLTEEQIDAAMVALGIEREAAEDNLKDGGYASPEAVHDEEVYADGTGAVLAMLGEAWTHPTNGVTHEQVQKAHELLQTDWDAHGSIAVHLPRVVALRLFEQTGGRIEQRTAGFGSQEYDLYIEAHEGDSTFNLDEAVTTALVATSYINDQVVPS